MSNILIKGAKVVNEGRIALLDVLIEGERIVAIEANMPVTSDMEVIDASN